MTNNQIANMLMMVLGIMIIILFVLIVAYIIIRIKSKQKEKPVTNNEQVSNKTKKDNLGKVLKNNKDIIGKVLDLEMKNTKFIKKFNKFFKIHS